MDNCPVPVQTSEITAPRGRSGSSNVLQTEDASIHAWYRFVLSFPPHLVRQYLTAFGLDARQLVLDPFSGTGTTLVEAKKGGIPSVGGDAHPFAAMVSRVKTDWSLDPKRLRVLLRRIIRAAGKEFARDGLESLSFEADLRLEPPSAGVEELQLSAEEEALLPTGFLSQRPLRRLLVLREAIGLETRDEPRATVEFFLVALAHVIANGAGNFAFGPEIYRTKPKPDYDVLAHFARHADLMVRELTAVQRAGFAGTPTAVFQQDARALSAIPDGIAAVITSPPYPNEKDYTRTTRVESILLRLVTNKLELREIKESLLRSNTRNVFVDDTDSQEVQGFASIQAVCQAIERRRVELAKDSGFERLYHKVVGHYFGGMRRHFRALRPKLRPQAKLAYVVGDQLSFLMVHVATARLLAEVAEAEGYRALGCELWRERVGTKVRHSATGDKTVRVREEILVLHRD